MLQSEPNNLLREPDDKVLVKVTLKYKPYLLIVDQILRVIFFITYLKFNFSVLWLIAINIIVTIVEFFIYLENEKKIDEVLPQKVNPAYKDSELKYKLEISAPDTLTLLYSLLGAVFTYWILYREINNHEWYMHLLFMVISLFGSILFLLTILGTDIQKKGKISIKKYSVEQIKKSKAPEDVTKYFPNLFEQEGEYESISLEIVDYNDIQIIKLESDLKNINNKVDAYLLESVLLGGLAFSGFLTVLSSNILQQETESFTTFCKNCVLLYRCVLNEGVNYFNFSNEVFHRDDYFVLIMLLCLTSSVFFLLVLTLRLRYMGLLIHTDYLIRIMLTFNSKEEELTNIKHSTGNSMSEIQQSRLEKISHKIAMTISDADKLMEELNPLVIVMTLFRNIAIIVFYIVLIVSGFYFSDSVAVCILAIAIFTMLLRYVIRFKSVKKIKQLLKRHE